MSRLPHLLESKDLFRICLLEFLTLRDIWNFLNYLESYGVNNLPEFAVSIRGNKSYDSFFDFNDFACLIGCVLLLFKMVRVAQARALHYFSVFPKQCKILKGCIEGRRFVFTKVRFISTRHFFKIYGQLQFGFLCNSNGVS